MTVATANRTTAGTLVSSGCSVLGVWVRSVGTAGSVVLKDGGSSGTVKLTIDTPAAAGSHFLPIAGGGLQFAVDVYVAFTQADGCTVVYATTP